MQNEQGAHPLGIHIRIARKHHRRELSAEAIVRSSNRARIGGKVLDISENGCKLSLFRGTAFIDNCVTVKMPNVESWPGTIRWVNDTTVGIEFDRPLYSAVVDYLSKSNLEVETD